MYGEVRSIERLTPNYVRVVLGGDGLAGFGPREETDSYVNVAIPPPGASYSAPFDLDDLRDLPRNERPFRRRYTVRSWDAKSRELTLEIIVHGDLGAGGAWALAASPGDALVFTGPAGGYRPDPGADWHLLAGDESAMPAITASLEVIPAGVPALVRLVCDGPEHELALESPAHLDLEWLHRSGGQQDETLLASSIGALPAPEGRGQAFVHGEAAEIRAVRAHLLADWKLDPADLSCSPYWRRGLDDEAWRQVKAAWNAEVAADVPLG